MDLLASLVRILLELPIHSSPQEDHEVNQHRQQAAAAPIVTGLEAGFGALPAAQEQTTALAKVESSRAVAEVQAAIVVARRFPRDEEQVRQKILRACARPRLAEVAVWELPRGGQMRSGISIRLMEEVARLMGNLQYGWREIERREDSSLCEAFAWDMESNVRPTRTFEVPHYRKAGGQLNRLTDPRDIYEYVASAAMRRVRSCVEQVVPSDVLEEAREACDKAVLAAIGPEFEQRIAGMLEAFGKVGVSAAQIRKAVGCDPRKMTRRQFLGLKRRYQAIVDGVARPDELFRGADAVYQALQERPNAPKAPSAAEQGGVHDLREVTAREDVAFQLAVNRLLEEIEAAGGNAEDTLKDRLASIEGDPDANLSALPPDRRPALLAELEMVKEALGKEGKPDA